MTDKASVELNELEPGLGESLEETGRIVFRTMAGDDPVLKFLCAQWESSLVALPEIPPNQRDTTRRLINHMGGLALTFERLQTPGSEHFLHAAAGILRQHIKCFGEDLLKGLTINIFRPDVH